MKIKKINWKQIKYKKIIKWVLIIGVIAFVAFSFLKKSKPEEETNEVMSSKAVIGNVESVISGTGTLSPASQYDVKSLVKGTVLKAPFEEGDTVKKGSLLYQISTNDIANSIKTSELGVKKAKEDYNNYVEKKSKLTLASKETGYIKKLYVSKGDTVATGKTIADIYDDTTMYLDLAFPSGEVKKSWVGKKASISMDAIGEETMGVVSSVSNLEEVMDGGILTKKVTIKVKNIGGIKVGDSAEATIGGVSSSSTGTFRAKLESKLIAESEGTIKSLSIKEGQLVHKGDTILTLSSKDLENQIDSAKLSIEEAQLALETQKDQRDQYTIQSPISGQVITKTKKQGDTIDPTTDSAAGPMATIYDLSYLTFQMNIDELQISSVKVGQQVTITTEDFPNNTFDGVIERISLKGNTTNGVTAYPVVVKVEKYGKLLPGMNVNGKIIIEKANNVLTIPSSALQKDNIVYVKSDKVTKNQDSSIPKGFKPVTITIGINDGTNVQIKDGLKEGDEVYIPFDDTVTSYYGEE
ncbi:efflux RND transporter periplasmic adaptor subunit [Anaeromicropila herbilytica]|uniref:Secretion protein HlyD n=1 Tax=Anaeromicropila herbilytica TaxID=2785025 RepID=A0A7R7EI27_9FIRM|nr:efflux RND transporter periplasmic adaptor subunit [Anaeromicropila herbilytica]BCN29124.1 secretion protein HlyD [Anaeromicropila herbilytica]